MNQRYNSQNQGSQLSNNNSYGNQSISSNIDGQHLYSPIIQFIPPQHKYIEIEKYHSSFFRDNNEEEYVIQRAFQANNFTYLRNLPDNFARNCILDERKQRVKQQVKDEQLKRSKNPVEKDAARRTKMQQIKKAQIGSLGYFEVFPYKESDYQLPKKIATKERLEELDKRKEISELEFRPIGFDKKMKYEDPFRYIDRLDSTKQISNLPNNYLFPFHLPEDTYNVFKEDQRRSKIVQQELRIAGQFYPSKRQQSLNNVSKGKLPEILNQIEFYFKKYLKGNYGYFIGVNKRDYIEIFFQQKFINDQKLQMILSGMLENEILCKFALRRNFDRWGGINQKTNYLQFVILPPWVKDPEQKLRAPTAPTNNTLSRGKFGEV